MVTSDNSSLLYSSGHFSSSSARKSSGKWVPSMTTFDSIAKVGLCNVFAKDFQSSYVKISAGPGSNKSCRASMTRVSKAGEAMLDRVASAHAIASGTWSILSLLTEEDIAILSVRSAVHRVNEGLVYGLTCHVSQRETNIRLSVHNSLMPLFPTSAMVRP